MCGISKNDFPATLMMRADRKAPLEEAAAVEGQDVCLRRRKLALYDERSLLLNMCFNMNNTEPRRQELWQCEALTAGFYCL